jgi:Na+/proline symporter
MIQPAQWMRYYAARSAGSLRRAALIFSLVLTACFILGVMLIGVAGQVLYPLTYSLSEPLAAEVSLADAPPELAQHVELVRDADAARAQLRWTWSGRGERQIDAEQAAALRALSEEPSYRAAVERLVEMAADPDVRPEVTAHRDVVDYNSILVVVLANDIPAQLGTFGAIFGSLVIVAIMAASMSTADSNLHALSAMATRDLYDPFIRPQASERERVWVGRLVIVAATAVAVVVVIVGSREAVRSRYDILTMIAQMGLMAIAFSSQLLPLAVDMCFLRKGTRAGVSAGLAAGLAGAFLMGPLFRMFVDALGDPAQLPAVLAWLPSLLSAVESLQGRVIIQGAAWGLLLNVPVFVVVSIFTRRVDPEKVAAYTKVLAQPAEETRAGLA